MPRVKLEDCNVKSEFFTSVNGWTTIMEQYLKWISNQMQSKPFALIVDCFKAHLNQKVKNLAKSLGIELIIVPACGTGKYQPLDRKIFGIVKEKMRVSEKHCGLVKNLEQEQLRFTILREELEKAWQEVSQEALQSAWNMPGLNKLMAFEEKSQEQSSDEEFVPDE